VKRALVFPGQGSQAVGMGRELAAAFATARETFEEIDDALGQKLSRIMFEGPESDLTLTENAQPALMAASLAVTRVLTRDGGMDLRRTASFVAGHSLGEYSALAAAGALTVGDAARLLKRRGQAMQRAVPVGVGAMAALLGLEIDEAKSVAAAAAQGQVCNCANDNGPGQVVVSGDKAAVERAIAIASERGARRSILLPVSAPFHCALMAPAAREMAEALAAVALAEPVVPLIANISAAPTQDADEIRGLLVAQVTGLVRWRESVLAMRAAEVEETAEVGTGRVLTGLAKRIDRELSAVSVGTPAEIEAFLKRL
jgi:[acyl-carrier-protein] S-malonyltransferase